MKAIVHKEVEGQIAPWQTIYCSLILIMLVLFVMLSAYSTADRAKMKGLQANLSGGRPEISQAGERKGVLTGPLRPESLPHTEWIKDVRRSLQAAGAESGLSEGVVLEMTPRGLNLKFKNDVLFPSGQAVIKRVFYPYLDELVRVAGEQRLSLKIEGHTDDVPMGSGAFSSNWELSTARATNVLRYFAERGNVAAGRLSAAGFGQYRPLAPNDTPAGRAQNRRIEVLLLKDNDSRQLDGGQGRSGR